MVSEHETFGMVYIEAMLAGCVTIASKNGGVDGVIVDGENGFLSQEGNASELMKLLRDLDVMSKERRTQIRVNAISTAKKFSDDNVARAYLENVIRCS
jgi:glycosyltransferase involved in cell wall biosynthesis